MTVHYLNRGTRYHIGDDTFSGSADADFVGAYGVIGQAWAQPFTVSHDDSIEVLIEKLWGVDYGTDNRVYIGNTEIGRIGGEHNRGSWTSPGTWAVKAGTKYVVRIAAFNASGMPGGADDFVFEGVVIRTRGGATVATAGAPKVLKGPEDDYWSSTYDTGESVAPSVEIHEFTYVEDKSTDGPDFVANFSTHGLQGRKLQVCVFVKKEGVPVTNSGDEKYRTPDGHLTVQTTVTPNYVHTRFPDLRQWIPWNQFYRAEGKVDYSAQLQILHDGKALARKDLEMGFTVDRGL